MSYSSRNILAVTIFLALFTMLCAEKPQTNEPQWISLFNGQNLDGWTPKFAGHELGDNYLNTFRVEDGVLKVSYNEYEKFDNKFGHIFYKEKFSHYKFRCQYRFVGEQVPEGPSWAFRNNGVMVHCQDPASMAVAQNFPVCIEVQLLGGNGQEQRSTANLCTPGTNVVLNGQLELQHCINSISETFHGDQWVTCEIEVSRGDSIKHFINGELVLAYEKPQYDERDADAQKLIKDGNLVITEGYIALQAESHPTEFRNIKILPLD
jgi:hypothetical protein